ncbi:MAG: hypothetical protein AB7K09_11090 [Planctomycetota bacterium]
MRSDVPPPGWRVGKRSPANGTIFFPSDTRITGVARERVFLTPRLNRLNPRDKQPAVDWADVHAACLAKLSPRRADQLACELDVSTDAVRALGAGWYPLWACWTWPMRDATGRVVGISTRDRRGQKRCLTHSRLGLFVPDNLAELPDPVLIVEGASDCCAAWDANLAAVGRPSARLGVDALSRLLLRREVLVLAENDRKPDGRWPGREGAHHVATSLAIIWERDVTCVLPPSGKDLRCWLSGRKRGGE